MSIFGSIISAIFGSSPAASAGGAATSPNAPAASGAASGTAASSAPGAAPSSAQPLSQVDVEAVMTGLAAQSKEKLDWRRSIVDLMKLLKLDSSLTARKALAKELNYTGDTNDSATMNMWLHKQVMQKLAANGGKVPADPKD